MYKISRAQPRSLPATASAARVSGLLTVLLTLLLLGSGRSAQATGANYLIYGDSLAPGWQVVDSRANVQLDNSNPTYDGSRSIKIDFAGGDGYVTLQPETPLPAADFDSLQFALIGYANDELAISVLDSQGNSLQNPALVQLPYQQWSLVEVPLAASTQQSAIAGIRITKFSNVGNWAPFYIDQISLIGAQPAPMATATAVSGTPTSTATLPATATPAPPTQTGTATLPATTTPAPPTPTGTATSVPPTPTSTASSQPPSSGSIGIIISASEVGALPSTGPAWQNVLDWAQQSAANPDIADQNDQTDAVVVAKALVYVRTGQAHFRDEAVDGILAAMGSEQGSGILAVGRNLAGYIVAADLVGLEGSDDVQFRAWLDQVRFHVFNGAGPDLSIVSCHEGRPNNFGTHCGTSRLAAALYLGDDAEVARAATVFRGYLGDRTAYTGFSFGSDLSWQCDPDQPVGINPAGCQKSNQPLGGVLPDDQRRGGSFTWPPPQENYVWEALQGAVAQARILERQGYDAFNWSDQALLRAVTWVHQQANYPATGDDTATPWLINGAYGTSFPASTNARPGKNGLGWYDWFYGGS